MLPDYEGSIRLLAAMFKLWIKDARDDPEELATVARWLGMTPAELRQRMTPAQVRAAVPGDMICPMCGGPVEWSGRGRFKVYCSVSCGSRARRLRGQGSNHVAR